MSATEIIAEIKKLSPPEQEEVLTYLQRSRSENRNSGSETKYVGDPDFDKAAEKVLNERAELFRRLAK